MARAGAIVVVLVAGLVVGLLPVAAASEPRVVSLGGDITETVFALGAGEALVAVDSTSRHPPEARELPDVGYLRRLGAEPIIALRPTLVLASKSAGPAEVVHQLKSAGIRWVSIPDTHSPEGVLNKVQAVAAALDRPRAGARLAQSLREAFAALPPAPEPPPRVLFLFSVGRGAPLAAGRDTSAEAIIELAGGRNALDGFEGFKPVSAEALVAAAPEVVVMPQRSLELLGGTEAVLARPGLAATPAGRQRRLIAMDGLLLLGFGPRTPEAAAQLAQALDRAMGDSHRAAREVAR